jgi:hypothetical protein
MLDSSTTWIRRLSTVAGIASIAYGLYVAVLPTKAQCPASTPTHPLACDPGPPTFPHLVLGLLIVAFGIAVLVAARRFFPYFESDS